MQKESMFLVIEKTGDTLEVERIAEIDNDEIIRIEEKNIKKYKTTSKENVKKGNLLIWNWGIESNGLISNSESNKKFGKVFLYNHKDFSNTKKLKNKILEETCNKKNGHLGIYFFVYKLDDGNYRGISVENEEPKKIRKKIRKKIHQKIQNEKQIFKNDDFIEFGEGLIFHKKLKVVDKEVEKIQETILNNSGISGDKKMDVIYDIVKDYFTKKNSRLSVKDDKTLKENKIFKKFINFIKEGDLNQEISRKCSCSIGEAEILLDEFISKCQRYIDGEDINTKTLNKILKVNPQLRNRLENELKSKWELENKKLIDDTNEEIRIKSEEKEKCNIEILNLENSINELLASKNRLDKDIERKNEMLGILVENEESIVERIKKIILQMIVYDENSYYKSTDDNVCEKTNDNELEYEENVNMVDMDDIYEELSTILGDLGIKKFNKDLAALLIGSIVGEIPLMIVGSYSEYILKMMSNLFFSQEITTLDCTGEFDYNKIIKISESKSKIIVIRNAFNRNWINSILDLIQDKSKYYYIVEPFIENVLLEPKGIYNYFTPVIIEPLFKKSPIFNEKAPKYGNIDSIIDMFEKDKVEKHLKKKEFGNANVSDIALDNINKLIDLSEKITKNVGDAYKKINDYIFGILPYLILTNNKEALDKINYGDEYYKEIINKFICMLGD